MSGKTVIRCEECHFWKVYEGDDLTGICNNSKSKAYLLMTLGIMGCAEGESKCQV
jgi:hypothetical protein